jgi:hypothetical protein
MRTYRVRRDGPRVYITVGRDLYMLGKLFDGQHKGWATGDGSWSLNVGRFGACKLPGLGDR